MQTSFVNFYVAIHICISSHLMFYGSAPGMTYIYYDWIHLTFPSEPFKCQNWQNSRYSIANAVIY